MAWDITTGPLFTIEIDNGWYTLSLPMLTIWMVVDEPYITIYWADSQKGRTGVTRTTGAIDYQDITFGYVTPSSASEVELEITNMIEAAFAGSGVQSITDDGNGIIEIDNTDPQAPVLRFTGKVPYILGMSSGLIEGGALSINADTSKFDIAAGNGIIVDDYTDPQNPVIYEVAWGTMTAIAVTNIASTTYTHVFLDNGGAVVQTNSELTGDERREYIYLGHIGHTNLTSIGAIVSNPDNYTSPVNQLRDLEEAIGTINLGVRVTANGANLNLDNSAGRIYLNGANFHTDNKNPSFRTIAADTGISWRYRTQTGAGSTVSVIEPASYDNAGTITAIVGVKATIQYIYVGVNGNFVIQYGQTVYDSLEDAELAALSGTDPFVTYANLDEVFVLTALLCVQTNATDLTDTNRALFINASKFGEVGVGGGGTSNLKTVNYKSLIGVGNVSTPQSVNVMFSSNNPISGTTRYFGNKPGAPSATGGENRIYLRRDVVITAAEVFCFATATTGSNENISIYIRVNDTTDTLIATVGLAQKDRVFSNTALSIALAAGDYFELKRVNPTWATPPTAEIMGGYILYQLQ